jgi:AcrR family transcriptional regulator
MPKLRPQRPSADVTRNKILTAALQLFMQNGFAGTSMSKLAEKADVNQTLIFHHFGNKMQLWGQVKAAIVADVAAKPVQREPETLHDFLNEIVQQRLSIYTKCPQLIRLVGWQRMESAKNKQSLTRVPSTSLSPLTWMEPIKFLQDKKLINPALSAELLVIWLVSGIEGMIVDDIGVFKSDPGNKQLYSSMIINVLAKGLAA